MQERAKKEEKQKRRELRWYDIECEVDDEDDADRDVDHDDDAGIDVDDDEAGGVDDAG